MRALARRHGINQKTVAKWKKRESTADRRTGPTVPRSTVLTVEQEAIIVAFRKHTLLPLDDCLYALQATIPQLTRSSLHRCLERHGISRLPDVEGDKPRRKKFDTYPIGFFRIDLAEVRTAEGKLYLFVAIDRTSNGHGPHTSCRGQNSRTVSTGRRCWNSCCMAFGMPSQPSAEP
jgi:transposase-like protein